VPNDDNDDDQNSSFVDLLCIQNTHFIFNNFFPKNRPVYDITWKNLAQPDRSQMTMQYVACALYAG
jgi:hypothetical protein